jgi:hypothetical protein
VGKCHLVAPAAELLLAGKEHMVETICQVLSDLVTVSLPPTFVSATQYLAMTCR